VQTEARTLPAWVQRIHPFLPALTCAVALSVVLLRVWKHLVSPVLYGEDGTYLFSFYFTHHELVDLFTQHHWQFLPLATNVATYVAMMLLPLTWVPASLVLYTIVVSALVFGMFSWKRHRVFVESDLARAGICLLLVVLPLGNWALLASINFGIWALLAALFLLAIAPLPKRVPVLALQTVCMAVGLASQPGSFVVAPVLLARAWVAPGTRERVVYGLLLAILAVYVRFGVNAQSPTPDAILTGFVDALPYVLSRVVVETTLGLAARLALDPRVVQILGAAIVAGLGLLWMRQYPRLRFEERALLLGCTYAIAATSVVMITSRGADLVSPGGEWAHRYGYVQRFFFVILASALIGRACARLPLALRVAGGTAVAVAAVLLNLPNLRYYDIHDQGYADRVAAFVRDLDEQRRVAGPGERIYACIDRGRWTILVDTWSEDDLSDPGECPGP